MKRTSRAWMLSIMGIFALSQSLPAQETTAGVQGTVKDSSGGRVANATVEVTSPNLLGERKVQTDSAGAYRFSALPPGDYALTVTAKGFAQFRQPALKLDVGRLPTIDITLQVGAVNQVVEVSEAS